MSAMLFSADDMKTRGRVVMLTGHTGSVCSLLDVPERHIMLSGGWDRTMRVRRRCSSPVTYPGLWIVLCDRVIVRVCCVDVV